MLPLFCEHCQVDLDTGNFHRHLNNVVHPSDPLRFLSVRTDNETILNLTHHRMVHVFNEHVAELQRIMPSPCSIPNIETNRIQNGFQISVFHDESAPTVRIRFEELPWAQRMWIGNRPNSLTNGDMNTQRRRHRSHQLPQISESDDELTEENIRDRPLNIVGHPNGPILRNPNRRLL